LNEDSTVTDQTQIKADFAVLHGGAGWGDTVPNFEKNILALYQQNIPAVLQWEIVLPDIDAGDPNKTFPPEAEEPNVAAIYKATHNKAIAGIIIRFLDKTTPQGTTFTQVWMRNYIAWVIGAVYHVCQKPLYIMTSEAFVASFGDAPELNQMLSGADGMCSWKSAFPGQETELASWDALPIPPDSYVPEWISDNKTLYFVNYARTAWRLIGIDGDVPLWEYRLGDGTQIKKDLGYVDHAVITPAVDTTPIPAPESAGGVTFTLTEEMNVRTGPGVGYKNTGVLEAGTQVTPLDIAGASAWIEIASGQWVCAQLNSNKFLTVK
jgi:hypothetical protein